MTRSGAPLKYPRPPREGTRSFLTKAMSGPRTVSGFDASLKPTSAPMTPEGYCSRWRFRRNPIRITIRPWSDRDADGVSSKPPSGAVPLWCHRRGGRLQAGGLEETPSASRSDHGRIVMRMGFLLNRHLEQYPSGVIGG